jgi:hypothetical protein
MRFKKKVLQKRAKGDFSTFDFIEGINSSLFREILLQGEDNV